VLTDGHVGDGFERIESALLGAVNGREGEQVLADSVVDGQRLLSVAPGVGDELTLGCVDAQADRVVCLGSDRGDYRPLLVREIRIGGERLGLDKRGLGLRVEGWPGFVELGPLLGCGCLDDGFGLGLEPADGKIDARGQRDGLRCHAGAAGQEEYGNEWDEGALSEHGGVLRGVGGDDNQYHGRAVCREVGVGFAWSDPACAHGGRGQCENRAQDVRVRSEACR
jgi:hypothetical protein